MRTKTENSTKRRMLDLPPWAKTCDEQWSARKTRLLSYLTIRNMRKLYNSTNTWQKLRKFIDFCKNSNFSAIMWYKFYVQCTVLATFKFK